MPEEIKEPVFDAAALAAELDAEEAAAPAEEVTENAPSEEATPEAPAETAPQAVEEEDDEKWAASHGGKPIPQPAFQARLARWKKKETGYETKLQATQAELEAIKRSQPMNASDVEKFRRLDSVFQNLDRAALELPWVTDMLLALGQGKKPDWEKVQEGMANYLASVPKGDPILYQQQQELRAQVEELQSERLNNAAISHIQSEDVEITKILGDKSDPVAATWWAILNEQAKHAFEAMNPKSFKEGPNRVQMAKRLVAAANAYHQKQLKAAVPPANRPKVGVATGNGAAGNNPLTKAKAPSDPNSPEYMAWLMAGIP